MTWLLLIGVFVMHKKLSRLSDRIEEATYNWTVRRFR